jgi:hypothetical protein
MRDAKSLQLAQEVLLHRALCSRARLHKWEVEGWKTSTESGIKYQVSSLSLHMHDPIPNRTIATPTDQESPRLAQLSALYPPTLC